MAAAYAPGIRSSWAVPLCCPIAAIIAAVTLAQITLDSGRDIELTELQISSTYDGLLEGYPNEVPSDPIADKRTNCRSRVKSPLRTRGLPRLLVLPCRSIKVPLLPSHWIESPGQ